MTATPIPAHAGADRLQRARRVEDLDDLPPGRTPVTTPASSRNRGATTSTSSLRDELDHGRQAYVIYPLVEGSEKSTSNRRPRWPIICRRRSFRSYRVALLHGRMKSTPKDARHAAPSRRDNPHPGLDDGRRGGRRRAERVGDGGGARRAVRPVAAASVARPRRPWTMGIELRPALPITVDRRGARAAAGAGDDQRRFCDCREGSRAARAGRLLRNAPIGSPRLRTGDLVRDRDIMEQAHREARRLVTEGVSQAICSSSCSSAGSSRIGLVEVGKQRGVRAQRARDRRSVQGSPPEAPTGTGLRPDLRQAA